MFAGVDVGVAIALVTSLAGLLSWYRSIARSQYAHEREFAHIMRNLEQQSKAVADIADQVDELGGRFAAVTERQSRLETLIIARLRGEG